MCKVGVLARGCRLEVGARRMKMEDYGEKPSYVT